MSGLDFEEVWQGRVTAEMDGVAVDLMGREALIRNKKAAGRDKDRVDLRMMGVPPE